jgi:hypothetical protein
LGYIRGLFKFMYPKSRIWGGQHHHYFIVVSHVIELFQIGSVRLRD